MKVRAKFKEPNAFGFYGGRRRRDGDVFDIDEKHFSNKWMEQVKPGPKPKK